MTFSLSILHKPGVAKRDRALRDMIEDLHSGDIWQRVFDEPCEGPWNVGQHAIHARVWQWHLETPASHHVCMSDDLNVAPRFWDLLGAMVYTKPRSIIGLLSNHPAGPRLAERGERWYRTNSWVVGPAYVVPHDALSRFLPWYRYWIAAKTDDQKGHYGDDSSLNEWISNRGPRETWHPLPTIIEHRGDVETTWLHGGDCFSRERVSWRAHQYAPLREKYQGLWTTTEKRYDVAAMTNPKYWDCDGPLLSVGGAREDEAESCIG